MAQDIQSTGSRTVDETVAHRFQQAKIRQQVADLTGSKKKVPSGKDVARINKLSRAGRRVAGSLRNPPRRTCKMMVDAATLLDLQAVDRTAGGADELHERLRAAIRRGTDDSVSSAGRSIKNARVAGSHRRMQCRRSVPHCQRRHSAQGTPARCKQRRHRDTDHRQRRR